MGLWTKGYNRSISGQPRMEKTCIDTKMTDRILTHLNVFGIMYREYTGDRYYLGKNCTCTCDNRTVDLNLWNIDIRIIFGETDRIDIPTFMWKIRNVISDTHLTVEPILRCLVRNIERNDWKHKSGDWDRDTFLDINQEIFKK